MKLEDVLIHTCKYGMGAAVSGAIGACAGYTYGTLSGVNSFLAAQALAIAAVAFFTFRQFVESGFEESSQESRNLIHILGYALGGVAFALALKNLDIISKVGAVILGTLAVALSGGAFYAHTQNEYVYAE